MRKNILEEFITTVSDYHSNKYDYTKVVYINNYSKIEIICPVHGSFWQTPKNHYRSGCKLCADIEKSNKNFVEEARTIHKNKYDYSMAVYVNQLTPIIVVCPVHGQFKQLPKVHLSGSGCRKCYDEKPKYNHSCLEDFIIKANEIHRNKYDYSLSNYSDNKSLIVILCKNHGEFYQTPNSHLCGIGCAECAGNKKMNSQSFIIKANIVHDGKYNYSLVDYANSFGKVQIVCPIHGNFFQIAQDHLTGHGCYKCYKNISKMESDWLDSLSIPDDQEHRNVYVRGNTRKYKVDGLHNQAIYEFYGDFWHGNPSRFHREDINLANKISFGELYDNTMRREQELQKLGYNVITIWESDWLATKAI
jgi:G:T-mismatch repair DNA endonuclease (very short patch repair protein)